MNNPSILIKQDAEHYVAEVTMQLSKDSSVIVYISGPSQTLVKDMALELIKYNVKGMK